MRERTRFPSLLTHVDRSEWTRTSCPLDLASRQWILGVVAVQVSAQEGTPVARLRANITGGKPRVLELAAGCVIHTTFVVAETPCLPTLEPIEPIEPHAAASLAVFLDGTLEARVDLDAERLLDAPSQRAFAHVFCRWLRDGAPELGYDLTGFQSLPLGVAYERLIQRPAQLGATVSIAYSC